MYVRRHCTDFALEREQLIMNFNVMVNNKTEIRELQKIQTNMKESINKNE